MCGTGWCHWCMKLEENTEKALTFSARCALAAALVFVKLNQAGDSSDNVSLQKQCIYQCNGC